MNLKTFSFQGGRYTLKRFLHWYFVKRIHRNGKNLDAQGGRDVNYNDNHLNIFSGTQCFYFLTGCIVNYVTIEYIIERKFLITESALDELREKKKTIVS